MRRVPSHRTDDECEDDEQSDQHDPVQLERGADEEQTRRDEFTDRRTYESTV